MQFGFVKRYTADVVNAGPLHTLERPVRSLIAHERLVPYLSELLGPDYRYDEGQILVTQPGAGALILHNGNTPWEMPPLTYQVRDGRIYGGHVVVAYCLTDATEDQGGFAVVPGSHKSSFETPYDFVVWKEIGDWVMRVPACAGDAILFVDTATHGSWPWHAGFERRVVFCRYTAGMVAHAAPIPLTTDGHFDDWTPMEQRLLREPYAWRLSTDDNRYVERARTSVTEARGWELADHSHQIVALEGKVR